MGNDGTPPLSLAAQGVEMQRQHRSKQAHVLRVLYGQAVEPRLL